MRKIYNEIKRVLKEDGHVQVCTEDSDIIITITPCENNKVYVQVWSLDLCFSTVYKNKNLKSTVEIIKCTYRDIDIDKIEVHGLPF